MPVSDQDLDVAKQLFVDNSNYLKNIVQGDENTSVTTPSGTIDSIKKLQKNVLQDYAHVEQQANRDVSGGYPSLSGYKLSLQNAAGAVKSFLASLGSVSRNWSLPDADGTIALTSDVTASAALQEKLLNKAVDFTTVNDTLYPTLQAVKTYVDTATTGLLNDRGNWSAAGGTYPNTGGSGSAGAIRKGDTFYISVAGNLGGIAVNVGDSVRAMVNAPGQTAGSWNILEANIGYVPENNANKNATGGYAGLTLFKLNVLNAAGNVTSFFTTLATAARTYTLPDKDGTVAMLSDITGTNSGTNTGDETLASLLTKFGISTSFANGVQTAVMSAYAIGSNAVLSATDTVAGAFGKLQAQIKAIPYDFKFYTGSTKPAASQEIYFDRAARAYTLPANLAGSTFEGLVAATGATSWLLQRTTTGGTTTTIATISWAAGANAATMTTAGGAAINVLVGEKVVLTAAASQDSTLAKVQGTILATLT